jgi:hypothetical protein
MKMKTHFVRLLACAVIGLNAAAASATTISGDWTGNWASPDITATFTMTIGAQDSLGRFDGSFNWTCTSGIACSGIESFSGGVALDSFTFWTTGFTNPVNLGPSIYWGNISNDGNTLTGFDVGPRDKWSATRVNSVPEPGTLALMSLGLFGVALSLRKKLPATNHLQNC